MIAIQCCLNPSVILVPGYICPSSIVRQTPYANHPQPRRIPSSPSLSTHQPYQPGRIGEPGSARTCALAPQEKPPRSRGADSIYRGLRSQSPALKLVMLLIDTSVWISVFRDRSRQIAKQLETLIAKREVLLTSFTQLELLQGSLNKKEWILLSTYLETQDSIELTSHSWQAAARIYYDLRRQGLTLRSPIDCCIAQSALDHHLLLIHNDRDFETIAQVRSLQHFRFQP